MRKVHQDRYLLLRDLRPEQPYVSPAMRPGNENLCNRVWPVGNGSLWKDERPFYQSPQCTGLQSFPPRDSRRCMRNRTIYAIGNSIGRQAAFGMVEMLGGNPTNRNEQKQLCPKHETTWDASCVTKVGEGTTIKSLYLQWMDGFNYSSRGGFPFFRSIQSPLPASPDVVSPNAYLADDNCVHSSTRDCLRRFFANSTQDDVLIFSVGMSYTRVGAWDEKRFEWRMKTSEEAAAVDMEAWLRASALAFQQHLAGTFAGKVFRQTLSPFVQKKRIRRHDLFMTPYLREVDDLLWKVWSNQSWYTVDQWDINRGREALYDDTLHFNGKLTHAMLHQVLNMLCPGGGDGEKQHWPHPEWRGRLLAVATNTSTNTTPTQQSFQYYHVGATGTLHPVTRAVNGSFPGYVNISRAIIPISSTTLDESLVSAAV